MAQKEFTIEVGKGRFAEDAAITQQHYGMDIKLTGVDPADLVAILSPDEIAAEESLTDLLKALVKIHGLGEVIYSLVENNDTTEIIKEVYEADDDAVRNWAVDTFSQEE